MVGHSCLLNEICVGTPCTLDKPHNSTAFHEIPALSMSIAMLARMHFGTTRPTACHANTQKFQLGSRRLNQKIDWALFVCARARSAHTSSGSYRNQLGDPSEARYRSNNGTTTAICGICAIPFALSTPSTSIGWPLSQLYQAQFWVIIIIILPTKMMDD